MSEPKPSIESEEQMSVGVPDGTGQENATYQRFTGSVRAMYCDEIKRGGRSHRQVCARLKLNRSTVDKWLAKGRAAIREGDDGEATLEARHFVIEVEAAQAERDGAPMDRLYEACKTDWRAALAMVKIAERRAERRHEARLAELGLRRQAEGERRRRLFDLTGTGEYSSASGWFEEDVRGDQKRPSGGEDCNRLRSELEILEALASAKRAGHDQNSEEYLRLKKRLHDFRAASRPK